MDCEVFQESTLPNCSFEIIWNSTQKPVLERFLEIGAYYLQNIF